MYLPVKANCSYFLRTTRHVIQVFSDVTMDTMQKIEYSPSPLSIFLPFQGPRLQSKCPPVYLQSDLHDLLFSAIEFAKHRNDSKIWIVSPWMNRGVAKGEYPIQQVFVLYYVVYIHRPQVVESKYVVCQQNVIVIFKKTFKIVNIKGFFWKCYYIFFWSFLLGKYKVAKNQHLMIIISSELMV